MAAGAGKGGGLYENRKQGDKRKKVKKVKETKRSVPGLRTWSPTVLLAGLEPV